MHWSVFCRVIDNFGDAGFCLRLARTLRAHRQTVDFYIDDGASLAWMQADDANPVVALAWPSHEAHPPLGQVVIEAFGCELPAGVQAVIGRQKPMWINLEYLSAEAYVERCHGLPSPVMSGPAQGYEKRFFYPGFSAATGGLLREPDLSQRWTDHDPTDWWACMGLPALPGERQVSVFAYPGAPLDRLIESLDDAPTRLLVCAGQPTPAGTANVRVQRLPWLTQTAYDALLWSCDLNLVRGEDSFVRAQWAGKPFLWNIYPQQDGAHEHKLSAFLALYGGDTTPWRVWNQMAEGPLNLAPLFMPYARRHALQWRDQLMAGPELVGMLLRWADGKGSRS